MKKGINIYMSDLHLASQLREKLSLDGSLFDTPEIKIFHGSEQFLNLGEEPGFVLDYKGERFRWQGEKMNYMFLSARGLKEYHDDYNLNLKDVVEKYGAENAKILILPCVACSECNKHVKNWYPGIITDFCTVTDRIIEVDSLIETYFKELLVVG